MPPCVGCFSHTHTARQLKDSKGGVGGSETYPLRAASWIHMAEVSLRAVPIMTAMHVRVLCATVMACSV